MKTREELEKELKELKIIAESELDSWKKYTEYQLKQKDGIIDRLNDTITTQETESIKLELQLKEAAKILWPQIDLLRLAEKYGTYKVLLTYEQVCTLRELLKPFTSLD